MGAFATDKERRVVPRWRYTTDKVSSAELSGDPRNRQSTKLDSRFLAAKLDAWKTERNSGNALDLLCIDRCGLPSAEAEDAARWILTNKLEMTPQAIALARASLGQGQKESIIEIQPARTEILDSDSLAIQRIQARKRDLRHDPRSSLAWLDLCRSYTILGQYKQAEKSMRNALLLAPNHRLVLRAAVRFYLHLGEVDRAHQLLLTNRRTPYDPWLTAAELAVAQINEKTPRFARKGRQLNDSSGLPPEQLSELQSALGMLDLYGGAHRKARQLFRASLQHPTENAVAQARWASTRLSGITINPEILALPLNHEARCWRALASEQWEEGLSESIAWFNDEPYSSRPALIGSFIGLMLVDNPSTAKQLAERAIKTSPNDPVLINNLCVALAYLGEVEKAVNKFDDIQLPLSNALNPHVYLATAGLLKFRLGDAKGGRELYRMAEKRSPKKYRHVVTLFWLREELKTNPSNSHELLRTLDDGGLPKDDAYAQRLQAILTNKFQDLTGNSDSGTLEVEHSLLPQLNKIIRKKHSPYL